MTMTAAGTMYSGNRSPTHRRTSTANSAYSSAAPDAISGPASVTDSATM
ncbi:hypothetical protein DE4576_05505 [Mycobacterium marinum]|nr:hypothetical protein DE4576_05505 [Mycobacterium marinum]